jgi:hypothetical protein
MAEISGANAIGTWVTSTGTTTLTGNQRSIDYTPSVDLFEATAGADGNKTYVVGPKDGQLSMTLLTQGGSTGTALLAQIVEGQIGTITSLSAEASAGATMTFPAICQGATQSWPYADVCTINVSFQQNGARTDA